MVDIPIVLLIAGSAASPADNVAQSQALPARAQALLRADLDRLKELYEHFHRNPELSFHEAQTAARFAQELREAGFAVTTGVGGHGVVGLLRNAEGPTLMLRADMDALPVAEQTGVPYASGVRVRDDAGREVSVMHACGHDVHMTAVLGAARLLATARELWTGSIMVVGQPAEERGAGAEAMLRDGLFERFEVPDFAVALHVAPERPSGSVATVEGYALANVDMVDVIVRGVGGHGAIPHQAKDPVVLAAQLVLALQTIVSRELSPLDPAVVTVGSIHGGSKHNVIPEEVKLELTCRSYTDQARQDILTAIRRIAEGTARAGGVPDDRLPTVVVRDESLPSTYNDPTLTKRLASAFAGALGEDRVARAGPVMAGEDFGRYGRTDARVPLSIFWLGTANKQVYTQSLANGTTLPSLHSPHFAPDPEPTLATGVTALVAAALELLAAPKTG